MKLARLLETIGDAKRLALHLQQLALEHNFEYELDYRPAMHVGTIEKVQAIELTLSPRQVKQITDGVRAKHTAWDNTDVRAFVETLAVFVVIGEHSTTMHVFNQEEDPVEEYVDDDIEELVKKHIAPYGQFTKLT